MTTELVSLYTTICPVTNKILDGITSPQVNAIAVAPASSSMLVSSSSPMITSGSMPMSSAPPPSNSSGLEKALPSAASSSPPPMTTSTVFTSSVYTVSSCAPGAAACSSMMGSVTTEQVALYTTVCPVKESSKPLPPPAPGVSTTAVAPVLSSSGVAAQSGSAAPGISPVVGEAAPYANVSAPGSLVTASQPSAGVFASQAPLFTTSTVYATKVYSKLHLTGILRFL